MSATLQETLMLVVVQEVVVEPRIWYNARVVWPIGTLIVIVQRVDAGLQGMFCWLKVVITLVVFRIVN